MMNKLLGILLLVLVVSACKDEPEVIGPNSLPFKEQLAADIEKIDQHLMNNNIVAEEHPSGIRYVVEEPGTGVTPSLIDLVEVAWVGKLLDGRVYQQTDSTLKYLLSNILTGWKIGVPLIKEGGSITLYLPSGLAFGPASQPSGIIGPNEVLIYEIDLVKVEAPNMSFAEQWKADSLILDEYFLDSGITAQRHYSGLRYVITEQGTGDEPHIYDNVTVNYVGRTLAGIVFDRSGEQSARFNLNGLILGWQIGFPLLKEGTKATLYLPSGMAYGSAGTGAVIGPNEVLEFEVELVSID